MDSDNMRIFGTTPNLTEDGLFRMRMASESLNFNVIYKQRLTIKVIKEDPTNPSTNSSSNTTKESSSESQDVNPEEEKISEASETASQASLSVMG